MSFSLTFGRSGVLDLLRVYGSSLLSSTNKIPRDGLSAGFKADGINRGQMTRRNAFDTLYRLSSSSATGIVGEYPFSIANKLAVLSVTSPLLQQLTKARC